MGVKFGQSVRINGMGPEKDFAVSFATRMEQLPELVISVNMPDAIVPKRLMATEATVVDVTVTGNTKGLKAYSTNENKMSFQNGTIYKVGNYYAYDEIKTMFVVETEYGKRQYEVLIPEDARKAEKKEAGSYFQGTLGAAVIKLTNTLFGAYFPGSFHQDVFLDGGTYYATNYAPALTRNPNRLLQELDLSGVSVSRGRYDNDIPLEQFSGPFPVMLVSPRHAVCNKHSGVSPGIKVYFMRKDGSLQMVTVIAMTDLPFDGRVVMFDQDVIGCEIYKTLPPDWKAYLPSLTLKGYQLHNIFGAVPVVVRQHNPGEVVADRWQFGINIINTNSPHLRVDWVESLESYGAPGAGLVSLQNEPLAAFHMRAYGGDSGSPAFMLIPNKNNDGFQPALVTSYWSGSSGPSYPELSSEITSAMNTMAAANGDARYFEMGFVDISHFTYFPGY